MLSKITLKRLRSKWKNRKNSVLCMHCSVYVSISLFVFLLVFYYMLRPKSDILKPNFTAASSDNGPLLTLYEHYFPTGREREGLWMNGNNFTMNGKPIWIYGGSMDYFRVPKAYWRDRLRKMRAAGLNVVTTYVPWNLHEPEKGIFDFGHGNSDFEDFLDLSYFLRVAKSEDLFVILKLGPYIYAHWEFGGLPSWLLRDKGIKLRSSDKKFLKYVTNYFNNLLPRLVPFQITKGGCIIAFQIENEYGTMDIDDKTYLNHLKELMIDNNIVELMLTTDGYSYHPGNIPSGVLQTLTLSLEYELRHVNRILSVFIKMNPNTPIFVMKFWIGWCSQWSQKNVEWNALSFREFYMAILQYGVSVNVEMFHGGTNFGFMNGANMVNNHYLEDVYAPVTTSYDCDAPLTEAGDYTPKYKALKNLLKKFNPVKTLLPSMPLESRKTVYKMQVVTEYLPLAKILAQVRHKIRSNVTVPMELLNINEFNGQSTGYTVYRKRGTINFFPHSRITLLGYAQDVVIVLVNGKIVNMSKELYFDTRCFGYWKLKNASVRLGETDSPNSTIIAVVENQGRLSSGKPNLYNSQYKGLKKDQLIVNGLPLHDMDIIPLEFKRKWIESLNDWESLDKVDFSELQGPNLYKTTFEIHEIEDTFIDMLHWKKGIVIVNGFVLGRYFSLGPQLTLYLPKPFLKKGHNTIIIFELFKPSKTISFTKSPVYEVYQPY